MKSDSELVWLSVSLKYIRWIFQGFTVIAGFTNIDDKSSKLKEESSGRLHVIQLDTTSETQIVEAVKYVKEQFPQGKSTYECE